MKTRPFFAGALLASAWVSSASAATASASADEILSAARMCDQAISGVEGVKGDKTTALENQLATQGWARQADTDPNFHSYNYGKPDTDLVLRLPKSGRDASCAVYADNIDIPILDTTLRGIMAQFQHTEYREEGSSFIFERTGSFIRANFGQTDDGEIWTVIFIGRRAPSMFRN